MKGLFSVAAFALVLHGAGFARAAEEASEPTPSQVRSAAEAFDRGREAYKTEDYVEAAEQFESADANAPSAAALELAIRARDKAGHLDRAATLAALALARHPDDPNIQKIAPSIIERAKAELFELDLKCDEACDVTVAGKIAPGRRSTERTIFLISGTYAVRAGWSDDRSASKSVEAIKGEAGSLDFHAPEVVAAPAPVVAPVVAPPPKDADTRPKSGKLPPTVFWVGVGVTAALGGVSIWSGIDTQNNPGQDRVREACKSVGSDGTHSAECDSLYNQGVDKQHRTNLLFGVTAGLGVATAVVGAFFTDWGGSKKPEAEQAAKTQRKGFSIQPWVSVGSGASVGALGRF
ncbi:MAG TPA: hypothetical protein VGJ91_08015 [Polyangiaceae bacterium]|jgi:hypothetical protein